ncbi:hypothetical protein ACJJTC_014576 [Scirpophaga incertulas]
MYHVSRVLERRCDGTIKQSIDTGPIPQTSCRCHDTHSYVAPTSTRKRRYAILIGHCDPNEVRCLRYSNCPGRRRVIYGTTANNRAAISELLSVYLAEDEFESIVATLALR